MTDGEARGLVLERFYDARHKIDWLSLDALRTHLTMDFPQLANVCEQLGQHRLINFKPMRDQSGIVAGVGRITASGVDVVEKTARAPITITLHDQSVSVTGSTHVQIGGVDLETVQGAIYQHVETGSTLHTDEGRAYNGIGALDFKH